MQLKPARLAFFEGDAKGVPRAWSELEQELAALAAAGQERVRFTGGEPTQSPHLLLALQACRKASLRVELDTDARALGTGERAALLRNAGLSRIFVRLWGSSATAHDAVCGAGAFTQSLRGLRRAKQAGLMTDLVFRLNRESAAELPGAIELARALPANALTLELSDEDSSALSQELLASMLEAARVCLARGVRLRTANFPPIFADDVLGRCGQTLDGLVFSLFEGGLLQRPRLPLYALGAAGESSGFASALQRAGGVTELCHALSAWGAPLADLPACLGGQGAARPERATAEGVKHARCADCSLEPQCRGADAALGAAVHSRLAPRLDWLSAPRGPQLELVGFGNLSTLEREYTSKGLAEELVRLGVSVKLVDADAGNADADARDAATPTPLRVFANLPSLAKNLARVRRDGAPAVVLDFHLLNGIDELRSACGAAEGAVGSGARAADTSFWPKNVTVVSCFPGYAKLYLRAGVPLDHITWRPYPIHLASCPAALSVLQAPSILCGGNHLRDWETFDAAVRLAQGKLPIDSFGKTEPTPATTRARYRGRVQLEQFWNELAQSRFVVVPLQHDWRCAAGISVIAMALAIGRPVIASRIPAAEDHLRDGEDSLLVPPGDAQALAKALDQLEQDAALCERLAAGARLSGEKLSTRELARWLVYGTTPPAAAKRVAEPGPYRAW